MAESNYLYNFTAFIELGHNLQADKLKLTDKYKNAFVGMFFGLGIMIYNRIRNGRGKSLTSGEDYRYLVATNVAERNADAFGITFIRRVQQVLEVNIVAEKELKGYLLNRKNTRTTHKDYVGI